MQQKQSKSVKPIDKKVINKTESIKKEVSDISKVDIEELKEQLRKEILEQMFDSKEEEVDTNRKIRGYDVIISPLTNNVDRKIGWFVAMVDSKRYGGKVPLNKVTYIDEPILDVIKQTTVVDVATGHQFDPLYDVQVRKTYYED